MRKFLAKDALATSLPGLFWASMSQVYPWDSGTNCAVELGRRAAAAVSAWAASSRREPPPPP